jgi:hypothetical protein
MAKQLSLFPEESKYDVINNNYFGFEIFEDIFEVINEMKHPEHDMFNAGLTSAEGAVRRLREEYYIKIKQAIQDI